MYRFLCAWIFMLFMLPLNFLYAADSTGVRLSFEKERINGKEVLLTIKAAIAPGIKLYALQRTDADALYSTLSFDSAANKYLRDSVVEKGSLQTEKDVSVDAVVSYYKDSVLWQQKIDANATDSLLLKGTVSYLYKEGEEYKPGEQDFRFSIQPETTKTLSASAAENSVETKSLLWIFLTAFAEGADALKSCVPMGGTNALMPFSGAPQRPGTM